MKSEKIYLVWAHPRSDSLTAQVVEKIQDQAARNAIEVTTLDLYRRGFNPVLGIEDEPDWQNPDKQYSTEVHQLFDEMAGHDTAVIVFPLWWYSFPAMIKGYMERVWNYGLAYGVGRSLPFRKIRWVALVGGAEEPFVQYGWAKNLTDYVRNSASYIGLNDVDITFLYNTIGTEEAIENRQQFYQSLFGQARQMVDTL